MEKRKMIKDWTELISEMRTVEAMSCKPDFNRLHNGFITDEDETVKWNREQVEKNHIAYDKEVARLNASKNKARNKVMQAVYQKIQQEIELVPDIKHAKAFYQFAQNIAYIKSGYKEKIPFENIIYQLKEECELFKRLTGFKEQAVTEKEEVKVTKNESKLEKTMIEDYKTILHEAKSMGCNDIKALYHIPLKNMELIVKALEDVQQYRQLGTPEKLQDMKDVFPEVLDNLRQYLKIGTPKEYQAAIEKQIEEKPTAVFRIHGSTKYECKKCINDVRYGDKYCRCCGQKLDWRQIK